MYPMEPDVQEILLEAKQEALDMYNSYIGTEHVLLAMCNRKESYLNQLLQNEVVPYHQLKHDLEILFSYPKKTPTEIDFTDTMFHVLRMGNETRLEEGRSLMSEEDLTQALFQVEKSLAAEILRRYGVDIQCHLHIENHILEMDEISELTNLNAKMEHSDVYVFERETEIQMMIEVLLRKEKANPLLLGEAGVGKSAIVEALAQRLAQHKIPMLEHQLIYELNVNGLVAGTKYRGEFEEKIQKILTVVKKYPQVILFIDEIHHILGAGKAEGSLDVAGVMKPYLARKEIRCIGATTFMEYEQHFSKDQAMQRRFQSIPILEFDQKQMQELMKGKCEEYSKYHQIEIPLFLISHLIQMSDYYLPNRHFPDKTLDVLDLACAKAKYQKVGCLTETMIMDTMKQLSAYKEIELTKTRIRELKRLIPQKQEVTSIVQRMKQMGKKWNSDVFACFHIQAKTEDYRLIRDWIADCYQGKHHLITVHSSRCSTTYEFLSNPWLVQLYRNPFQVVEIIEFYKMNVEIQELLLQAMEAGYIEDMMGKKIDLRHCVFILQGALDKKFNSRLFITDVRIEDQMDKNWKTEEKMLS
ncbi:MAG: AAA family ATPase [Erysipelotrichaceae bacterium]|nr:AAA family ATPase [Erysipelotrichaceae bacterium]